MKLSAVASITLLPLTFMLLGFSAQDLRAETNLDSANKQLKCRTIRDIRVFSRDVYEDDDKPNVFEKSINFLHVKTKKSVITNELLFAEGDCVDHRLIEESARNLRAMTIFSDATINILPIPEENAVDIEVFTKDRFTLRAEVGASTKAGTSKTRLSFGEKNLFGLNKNMHISETDEEGEKLTRYYYHDPRLFQDFSLTTEYTKALDGVYQAYSISNPFRSFNDPSAFGYSYVNNNQNFVYSLDDNEQLEVPQLYESQSVFYQKEYGTRDISKRVGGSLKTSSQKYFSSTVEDLLAIPSRLEKIDFDLTATLNFREDFILLQGLDSLIYKEDIEIGKSFTFGAGLQWRDDHKGGQMHQKYQFDYHQTYYNGDSLLHSARLKSDARFHSGHLMELNHTAFYHGYYVPSPNYVWMAGATYQYRYGKDILNEPLTMGGDVGLRGYKGSTFTGNKSLLFNLEFRHRLPFDSDKIAIGQAFFVDSGYAWKHGEDINLRDMNLNVGWGLRFDVPSLFGKNILRLDVATPTNTGKVLFSLVLGQVYRYNELTENTQQEF